MRCGLLLLLFCMLSACGMRTASHNAITNATNSVDVLVESISTECKTPAIEKQIKNIKQQIESIKPICENDIAVERADKIKWKTAFFALLFVVLVFVSRKAITRVP